MVGILVRTLVFAALVGLVVVDIVYERRRAYVRRARAADDAAGQRGSGYGSA
jgi:hypothetical protein